MLKVVHRKHLHPQIKKHFDFSNDRYAWYWIYLTWKGKVIRVFNTYEWYIVKRTKNYVVWKNYYYDEKDSPIVLTKFKSIKKVVCWKTEPYNNLNWDLIEKEEDYRR